MAGDAGLRNFTTLARLALRGAGRIFSPRSLGPEPGMPFEQAMSTLLADPGVSAHVRTARLVALGAESGWEAVGFDVAPGDEVTVIAAGGFWASKPLDLGFGARIGLWLRAGGTGPIRKTPTNASSLVMESAGALEIVAKPPGEWADEQGGFDTAYPRGGVAGEIGACVIVWQRGAEAGLEAMSRAGDYEGLVARALDEARHPVSAPQGWHYLWRLGEGRIFREAHGADGRTICCHTSGDVGILQFPADFPLTENTRLRWRWKVDRLPCDLPEDIQPTHDYLSIAVEFDNGQDLTYMWSSSMAEGTIFRCPLPFWDKVETHWVLRSDPAGLGKWLSEEQPLKADYAKAVGAPPARIVKVWLIAVSVFQRHEGICEYADIELVDGDRVLKIT
jgi:hypothetical protein